MWIDTIIHNTTARNIFANKQIRVTRELRRPTNHVHFNCGTAGFSFILVEQHPPWKNSWGGWSTGSIGYSKHKVVCIFLYPNQDQELWKLFEDLFSIGISSQSAMAAEVGLYGRIQDNSQCPPQQTNRTGPHMFRIWTVLQVCEVQRQKRRGTISERWMSPDQRSN